MIKAVNCLPDINDNSVEFLKIKFNLNSYSDIAYFWVQDETNTIISMLDGNAVIKNFDCDTNELSEFLNIINPKSVFSDAKTLKALGYSFNKASVMKYIGKDFERTLTGEYLASDDIYKIFLKAGFKMPKFEDFATDYCHRLNHGFAQSIGIKDTCAAVLFKDNENILINGIASLEKGYGSMMLTLIANEHKDKNIFAVCEESVKEFYIKNGFEEVYKVGYKVE